MAPVIKPSGVAYPTKPSLELCHLEQYVVLSFDANVSSFSEQTT